MYQNVRRQKRTHRHQSAYPAVGAAGAQTSTLDTDPRSKREETLKKRKFARCDWIVRLTGAKTGVLKD